MDLGHLQHFASLAVSFDQQRNYEAARYYYLEAGNLINIAITNNKVRPQVHIHCVALFFVVVTSSSMNQASEIRIIKIADTLASTLSMALLLDVCYWDPQ